MVGSEQTNLQPNAREVVRGRFKVVEREGVFRRGELRDKEEVGNAEKRNRKKIDFGFSSKKLTFCRTS